MPRSAQRWKFHSAQLKPPSLKLSYPSARLWLGRELSKRPSMCCPDLPNISAFADGELEAGRAAEVGRHIAKCSSCRQLLEEFQWLDDRGRAAIGAIHVVETTTANIVWWRPLWLNRARPVSLAAAAVVVLAMAIWIWFSSS